MIRPEDTIFAVLVWAVAANSALAHFAGTCAMGGAGRLGGVWLSLVFLLIALAIWARRKLRWLSLSLAAAALPILVYHALFGVVLVWGVGHGQTACFILTGDDYPPDGAEAIYAALWLGQSTLIALLMVAMIADLRRLMR